MKGGLAFRLDRGYLGWVDVIGSVGDGFEDRWHGDSSLDDRSRENFALSIDGVEIWAWTVGLALELGDRLGVKLFFPWIDGGHLGWCD